MSDVKLWCPDDGGMVRAYHAEGKRAPIDTEYCDSPSNSYVTKENYDALREENERLLVKVASLESDLAKARSFERSVNEALNSGDGSYRP